MGEKDGIQCKFSLLQENWSKIYRRIKAHNNRLFGFQLMNELKSEKGLWRLGGGALELPCAVLQIKLYQQKRRCRRPKESAIKKDSSGSYELRTFRSIVDIASYCRDVLMLLLFIMAGLLVGLAVVAALATAKDLDRLKKELGKLNRRKLEAHQKWEEVQGQKKVVEGNRDILKRTKERKQEQIQQLGDEIEELKKEVAAEHEIATNQPVDQKPIDFEDEPEQEEPSAGKEIKTRQPLK
jgi:hypothetical protein